SFRSLARSRTNSVITRASPQLSHSASVIACPRATFAQGKRSRPACRGAGGTRRAARHPQRIAWTKIPYRARISPGPGTGGASVARKKPTLKQKTRTREHIVADLAVNHVERQVLLCGYTVERIAHDYGLDLILFTYTAAGGSRRTATSS